MNYFKRSIVSIIRKPPKTILLFLVIFILGNLIAGALSIKKALHNTEVQISQIIQPMASITVDYKRIWQEEEKTGEAIGANIKTIDETLITTIGKLPYVKYYDYTQQNWIDPVDAKTYTDDNENTNKKMENMILRGIQYHKILALEEDKLTLTKGRTFTEQEIQEGKNSIVISDKFAELNHLTVGAEFVIKEHIPTVKAETENNLSSYESKLSIYATVEDTFEVIGIYSVNPTHKSGNQNEYEGFIDYDVIYQQNTIYMSNASFSKFQKQVNEKYAEQNSLMWSKEDSSPNYEPVYILKESSMLLDFKKEVNSLLPDYSIVVDTTNNLSNVSKPINAMNTITNIVLYISIGVGILILSVLIILFLHKHRHEIDIYISMGERKCKIIRQILIEVMIIAILSMSLALLVGNLLAKDFSKNMLINQIDTVYLEDGYIASSDFGGLSTSNNYITADDIDTIYNISLDSEIVTLFYSLSIGTIIISTIAPTLYILRLKPKESLMK